LLSVELAYTFSFVFPLFRRSEDLLGLILVPLVPASCSPQSLVSCPYNILCPLFLPAILLTFVSVLRITYVYCLRVFDFSPSNSFSALCRCVRFFACLLFCCGAPHDVQFCIQIDLFSEKEHQRKLVW
jgi:hypothetical protein